MRSLLGDSMNTTSIQKVESNRFSRADLENKLLMVDDDMDMSALPKTNYIKSIVTSECKMDMERKGVQSYQSQLYVRFLCFGNGALTALHDKSDGFFRRQIVLTTKDRPAGRADDPFLVDKLLREKEGIFLWCLEGLHRLIGNNYQFSISGKARENMETVKRSSNNVIEFLQSEGYIRFRADSEASSKAIYEAYTTMVRRQCAEAHVCQPASAPSLHKMSGFTMWRPPTMSMSAASGCVALWALRWSIRRRIENEERTSKLPYTPYTLYGCF